MNRRDQIGFNQRIHLDWLEYTANLVLAGNPRDEIVAALSERLREKLSVGNDPERGNRDKAISILTKVWVTVPKDLQTLRDEGLDHLRAGGPSERMLVHWCMCMAVYPFFGTVADAVGRLLRLQGTAGAANATENAKPSPAPPAASSAPTSTGACSRKPTKRPLLRRCETPHRRHTPRPLGHQSHPLCHRQYSPLGLHPAPRPKPLPLRRPASPPPRAGSLCSLGNLPTRPRPRNPPQSLQPRRSFREPTPLRVVSSSHSTAAAPSLTNDNEARLKARSTESEYRRTPHKVSIRILT